MTDGSPLLSLCMIVKNETANLARCLESVRGLVDEIIVVDTGSTDNTVAIAESFGATVLHVPWTDDYSTPRNASLRAASGAWTLVLDADEVVAQRDRDAIRAAMALPGVAGYTMRTRNYAQVATVADAVPNVDPPPEGEGYPVWVPSDKVRLFCTDSRVEFRGAIHELVEPSIREFGGQITWLEVPVHHYGNCITAEERAEKLAMQRRIADRKVVESPDDFKAHYEWAVIAHTGGDWEDARAALERSIALNPDWARSQYELGYALQVLNDDPGAVAAYERALELDPAHHSAAMNLGGMRFSERMFAEAEALFRVATEHAPSHPRAWNNLGAALGEQGRYADAGAAWRRALELDPEETEARQNLEALDRMPGPTPQDHRPRVSLCMIVCDEEDNLRAAVEPVRGLVDEIVIVDTGSQDRTKAIATELGARVVEFTWCDDFAAARNAGLEQATGDWIIWLDADDRVRPSGVAALEASLATPADRAVQWCIESQSGDQEPVQFLQLRQFPRRAELRWRGRIHEEITSAVRAAGLPLEDASTITVVHLGYRDAAILARKHARNLRLLEWEIQDRPDSAQVLHHLSQTYALMGRPEDARRTAECILDLEPLDGDERYLGLQARIRLARLMRDGGDLDASRAYLEDALAVVPHFPPAEYALGKLHWQARDLECAETLLRHVAHARMPLSELPLPLPALRAGAWNILGRIAQERGEHEAARTDFAHALKEAPRVAVIHANAADSFLALGQHDLARASAERAVVLAPGSLEIVRRARRVLDKLPDDATGPLVSLCMIVKDEARNLRELLPSVAGVCDEIVIVDTGSNDETVAVAEACGARVRHVAWTDDFAAARNATLDMARGRWILWLDADDRIDPQELRGLRAKLARLEPQVLRVAVRATMPDGEVVARSPRIFPSGAGVRWAGRVHEDVMPACAAAGLTAVDCDDLVVRHVGYADADRLRAKMERNRRLLKLQLAEQPDDARAALYLVGIDWQLGDQHAAQERLVALEARALPQGLRALALRYRCAFAREDSDGEQWMQAARQWFELAADDPGARLSYGEALAQHDQWAEAVDVLEGFSGGGVQPGDFPLNPGAVEWRRHLVLGRAYRQLSRFEDAMEALGIALHARPDDVDTLLELGHLYWDAQRVEEADQTYQRVLALDANVAIALVQRGNHAFQRGEYDRAETFYARARTAEPGLRSAVENHCAVALARGDRPVARRRLTEALDMFPDAWDLRAYLADLDFTDGHLPAALDGYRLYLTAQPSDVKALTRLGDCLRLLGHASDAQRAYDAVLQFAPRHDAAVRGLQALAQPV